MNQQPIGIFDSGAGGLSVLRAIREQLPDENLIYVADTKHTPYGVRSNQFIEARVERIAEFLEQQSVKAIVVACNTATAAAINTLRDRYQFPIVGLEPAIKPAIEYAPQGIVGVLATQATLESEKYLSLKQRLTNGCHIIEKASAYFVELVESAKEIDDIELAKITDELAIFNNQIDALVLGCTHYPFLTDAIDKILNSQVKIFESAIPVALELQRRISDQLNQSNRPGVTQYFSSAPEQAKNTFVNLLSEDIDVLAFDID